MDSLPRPKVILVTTTNTIEGHPVESYLGLVTGVVIVGANIFRDIGASLRDIFGGRAAGYEHALSAARAEAIQAMQSQCDQRGGNAVIGVDLDYEVVGKNGAMLMVSVTGTAVRVRD
jgi:uncharacterized protein YbjQ (UPF0145 family)